MTKFTQYRLQGFLTTITPLHIAAPGALWFSTDTGRISYAPQNEDGSANMPCTGVQKLPFPKTAGEEFSMEEVPVIAANNLAGRLRRQVEALVVDALAARNERITLGTYSALNCGAVTGKPDTGDVISFEMLKARRNNVQVGLCGGGVRMAPRYFKFDNAVPFIKGTTEISFTRAKHPRFNLRIMPDKHQRFLTKGWFFRRLDDVKALSDMDGMQAVVENWEQTLTEYQTKLLADKAKDKGDRERISTTTGAAIEFVRPGVVFPITCELEVSDAQMGLFLLALRNFVERERMGGFVRNGFGKFLFDDVVLTNVETGEIHDNIIRYDAASDRYLLDGPMNELFRAAWVEAANTLSGQELDVLLGGDEESVSKRDEKAAKRKAGKA